MVSNNRLIQDIMRNSTYGVMGSMNSCKGNTYLSNNNINYDDKGCTVMEIFKYRNKHSDNYYIFCKTKEEVKKLQHMGLNIRHRNKENKFPIFTMLESGHGNEEAVMEIFSILKDELNGAEIDYILNLAFRNFNNIDLLNNIIKYLKKDNNSFITDNTLIHSLIDSSTKKDISFFKFILEHVIFDIKILSSLIRLSVGENEPFYDEFLDNVKTLYTNRQIRFTYQQFKDLQEDYCTPLTTISLIKLYTKIYKNKEDDLMARKLTDIKEMLHTYKAKSDQETLLKELIL